MKQRSAAAHFRRPQIATVAVAALFLTAIAGSVAPAQAATEPPPVAEGASADAADTPGASTAAAAGRATGSGLLGFIGEYGTTNNTSVPSLGEFNHPYGLAVDPRDGTSLVITDSGNVNWFPESLFSQVSGHSVQWLERSASFDPARGHYRGGGRYDTGLPAAEGFGGNFDFTRLARQRTEAGANLGPRGVTVSPNGDVFFTASQLGSGSGRPGASVRRLASDGTEIGSFGSWANGLLSWTVGVDLDSEGLVYVTSQDGYTVGGNLGSVVVYTPTGELVSSYPGSEIPTALGVVVGESSASTVEVWALSSPAAASSGRVVKFIAQKGGAEPVPGRNPAGWVWEVDPTFESVELSDRQFTLSADLDRGELYVMPRTGLVRRLDATTGASLGTLGASGTNGGPGRYGLARGVAADADGYLHVSTESTTWGSSGQSRVQLFARTPDALTGLTAEAAHDCVTLRWDPLPLGADTPYGQAQLLDYVVEYRATDSATWLPVEREAPSTDATTTVAGLTPETEYEFRVTPFNEAGSGDPAELRAVTAAPPGPGALSIEKLGNGQTGTADAPVRVEADSTVTFDYRITNTGESPVTDLTLVDDQIGDIELPHAVEPGSSVTATAAGTVPLGRYTNTATVTGLSLGERLEAQASWSGLGERSVILPPVEPPVTPPGGGDGGTERPGGAGDTTGDTTGVSLLQASGSGLPLGLGLAGLLLVAAGTVTALVRRKSRGR